MDLDNVVTGFRMLVVAAIVVVEVLKDVLMHVVLLVEAKQATRSYIIVPVMIVAAARYVT
jgi:hypothetical protein